MRIVYGEVLARFVEGYADSRDKGFGYFAGGLVGESTGAGSAVSNSYAIVSGVTARSETNDARTASAGGLIGYGNSVIHNTYSVVNGVVSSTENAGGLVGDSGADVSVTASYYNASRRGGEGAFGNTLGDARSVETLGCASTSAPNCGNTAAPTFMNWDAAIWNFGDTGTLPILADVPPCLFGGQSCRFLYADYDNDGVNSVDQNGLLLDNCQFVANPLQHNSDTDALGDACDDDDDDDGLSDADDPDADGDGFLEVGTEAQLEAIRSNLAGHYELHTNITLSTNTTNSWEPIGNADSPFSGKFDGNGHVISDLYSFTIASLDGRESAESMEVYSGLFGYISGAEVKDLGIVAHNITAVLLQGDGDVYAGVLAGKSLNSNISNAHVNLSGGISAHVHYSIRDTTEGFEYTFNTSSFAGGLIGQSMDSDIRGSSAVITEQVRALSERANPTTRSKNYDAAAGGLVGWSRGVVRNSYAVVGAGVFAGGSYKGGVSDAHATAGGLVGRNLGQINSTYAIIYDEVSAQVVTGVGTRDNGLRYYAGGLVGESAGAESEVINSYAIVGNVSARSETTGSQAIAAEAGGLVGYGNSIINNTYAVVNGVVSSNENAGGLVGAGGTDVSVTASYYHASRKAGEGAFDNSFGDPRPLETLGCASTSASASDPDCGGTASPTFVNWDATIWNFGDADTLPTLVNIPSCPPGGQSCRFFRFFDDLP